MGRSGVIFFVYFDTDVGDDMLGARRAIGVKNQIVGSLRPRGLAFRNPLGVLKEPLKGFEITAIDGETILIHQIANVGFCTHETFLLVLPEQPLNNLNFDRLSEVCGWLTTLPVYMFHGELTAALIVYAYERPDLNAVDHAVRMVLNYQASLEQPLHHKAFIDMVEQVLAQQPPPELVAFLAREVTH